VGKLLDLDHSYIITATMIAASPQILVTGAFAVWWLDNFYYQEWRFFFIGFIGYYSLVVIAVWVCCVGVCIRRERPGLSAYVIPATSVAAAMSFVGLSIGFIAPGLASYVLLILVLSLLLLGAEIVGVALTRRLGPSGIWQQMTRGAHRDRYWASLGVDKPDRSVMATLAAGSGYTVSTTTEPPRRASFVPFGNCGSIPVGGRIVR
jgi:hypothetical protein